MEEKNIIPFIEKKVKYSYQNDNSKYIIELIIKDINNFEILVINEENEYEIYELNLNLSELIKKSDFFQLCKTSQDFINYMNQLFDNKNIIFETNYQNDTLTMKWKFNTLFKIEELSFNLNKKQISMDGKINLISKNLENFKKEINDIKKTDIEKIYKKIEVLENKIKELEINYKQDIKLEIENYFKEKEKKEKSNLLNQKSLILTEEKELKFITDFIRALKPNSKLELIYRASVDCQMGKDFHSKCDNIFPTITLFKTNTNRKFGGYTESNWKLTTYGSDSHAQIFSINKEKSYKVNNCPEKSIYSDNTRGPNFDGLWVSEPFFNRGSFWETEGDHKCYPKESVYEMSEKKSDNVLTEIEVYKVIN